MDAAALPCNVLLVDALDAALPQTQCTRCGFPDCRAYAEAIASRAADINQCPPGGAQGIARLADLTGRPAKALDPSHGVEGPRLLAVIDEAWCIGCTLCLTACPVDCIVGAPKRMHTVIDRLCTGCELCIPPCPVDCIDLVPADVAWSDADAAAARTRHRARDERLARWSREASDRRRKDPAPEVDRKAAILAAAVARAAARRPGGVAA